ncbi:MAG TPA: DUF5675 family protein [Pseudomonadales bacterium]|nr:DUF5675 family protein [Pseudomonadales bacterium]
MKRVLVLTCLCLLLDQVTNASGDSKSFTITIYRQYSDRKCTSGYLAVNGNIICYTLERPWQNNESNISSIPAGTYSAIIRYDKTDHWRLQLTNVPDRSGIQIHIGNQTSDTEGCILVGMQLDHDLCTLRDSAGAYRRLKHAFYGSDDPVMTPDKTISVIIVKN